MPVEYSEEEPFLGDQFNLQQRRSLHLKDKKVVSFSMEKVGPNAIIKPNRSTFFFDGKFLGRRNNRKCFYVALCVSTLVLMKMFYEIYEIWRMHRIQKLVIISNNYSNLSGLEDLIEASQKLTDYCFPGMKSKCTCTDPMTATSRVGWRHWLKASHENKDSIYQISEDIDVVFYGDSIIEGWKGTSYGFPNGRKEKNMEVFQSLFTKEGNSKYIGLPLGISGDRSTDLLWRLHNGELPSTLNAKVFWILIGTNDLGSSWCSPETTLLGILRVVEELRKQRPGAKIVINSLMPRSFDLKKGLLNHSNRNGVKLPPLWNAIKEVNSKLQEYCQNHDRLIYFDSTDMFLLDPTESDENVRINRHLMFDFLHPSFIGYRVWGEAILKQLDEILKKF